MLIRSLLARLGVETDTKPIEEFDDAIDGAKEGMEDAGESAGGLMGRLANLNQVWDLAAKAASVVGGVVKDLTTAVAEHGAAVSDAASQVGLGTTALQRLQYAGEMTGSSAETVTKVLQEQGKMMRETAANSATPFGKALEEIGLKLSTLENMDAGDRIGRIGEALSRVEDKGKQAALSLALFGGEGPKVLALALEGRAGIAALGDEAERLGFVLGEEVVEQGAALDDMLVQLSVMIQGVKNDIGAALMPTIAELVGDLSTWIKANKDLIRDNVKGFIEGVIDAGKALAPILKTAIDVMSGFINLLGGAEKAIGPLVAGLGTLKIALMAALGPWGLVAAAAVAAGVAIVGAMKDSENSILATERAAKRLQETLDFEEQIKGKSAKELRGMLDELEAKKKRLDTIQEDVRGLSPKRIKELEAERALDQAEIKKRQEILGRVLGKKIAEEVNADEKKYAYVDDAARGAGEFGGSGQRRITAEDAKLIAEGEKISDEEELRALRRKRRKSEGDKARIAELEGKHPDLAAKPGAGGGKKAAGPKQKTADELVLAASGRDPGGVLGATAAPGTGTTVNNVNVWIQPTNNIGPFTIPADAASNGEGYGRAAGGQVSDALQRQNEEWATYLASGTRSGRK
jgi:hypothetical protein